MSQQYTRTELLGITAARHGLAEGQGTNAFLDLRIKVTPELIEQMLGGHWVAPDGGRARFDGVYIDDDGYAEPILVREGA